MYKVMIVEDDVRLRTHIEETLVKFGFDCVHVKDFLKIEEEFAIENPHLVLLDINLPYYDGFHFCRQMRKKSKLPIIIMSTRSSDMDQVLMMELGADDYLVKPFSIDVLLAKIKSSIRRVYGEYASVDSQNLSAGGINIDERSFKIHYLDKTAELTKNEFKAMKKLMQNLDGIVSREEMLAELWDENAFVDDNTLSVNMTRLKNKLKLLGLGDRIKTIRGAGYIFSINDISGEGYE